MEKPVFVTGNINKEYEMKERFEKAKMPLEVISFSFREPEINDIEVVSIDKAKQAYAFLQRPCFVIDSGFNIHHYPGNPEYPGAFVRRSGISENIDELLETLKDVKDRGAQFLDCLTYYDGEEFHCFYGKDEGNISYSKRGKPHPAMRSPLWYVFEPLGYHKTLAEMTEEERHNRKKEHISAKDQFIEWYQEKLVQKRLIKKIPNKKSVN